MSIRRQQRRSRNTANVATAIPNEEDPTATTSSRRPSAPPPPLSDVDVDVERPVGEEPPPYHHLFPNASAPPL